MPRKSRAVAKPVEATREALLETFESYPEMKIWERRLADPADPGSLPILLKDDPDPCCGDIGHALKAKVGGIRCALCKLPFRRWYVRWGNLAEDGRWSTLRARGYIKVKVSDLADAGDVVGMAEAKPDDLVTRGDRKGEVLVKIPFVVKIEAYREKQRRYNASMKPKALKEAIVADAEGQYGDHGGEMTHRHLTIEEQKRPSSTLEAEIGSSE